MARIATRRALLYRPRAAANLRALRFDGTGDYVLCGSGATLDDLHAGAFTVECWLWRSSVTAAYFLGKGTSGNGWFIDAQTGGGGCLDMIINTDGTNAASRSSNGTYTTVNAWQHIAVTYDAAGTRVIRIFIGGTEPSYGIQTPGTGNIDSDAAKQLSIGAIYEGTYAQAWTGKIGWVRISNSLRYTANFTPPAVDTPPATDANTVLLLKMDEGSGTTVTDSSGNGNHGTLYGNTTWVAL